MKKVISTQLAPAAIGPYSQAIQVNNTLYTSGQLGIDPETGDFVSDNITAQTEQVFRNLRAVLSEAGFEMSHVIKTTCFLSDMGNFTAMNDVYQKNFEGDFPARSAVAVKTLPKNGLVEIEVIAVKD
ncbi:RidA family protein [Porphyromonas pogonae]|uniref:RidA family protein n=1 Tax=Porphyromonas pogonae TaxID=867595 RepID=UPI002E76AF30|nr:RidA family protein [Porphyromonas pogonae]